MCIKCIAEELNFKTAQDIVKKYHSGMTVAEIARTSVFDPLTVAYIIEESA